MDFFLNIKFFFNWRLITLQYCIGFAIHQHESATGIQVFPILNPSPSSLPIPSLWVVSVYQPQASSIMHWTWTGDLFHIWYYTCFNAILPNHPTLSLSLMDFYPAYTKQFQGQIIWLQMSKTDAWTFSKYVNSCSKLYIIQEMHIKIKMRYFTLSRIRIIGKDTEIKEQSHIDCGTVK